MCKAHATSRFVGFARLGGRAVGIVANQPKVKGGVLMVDSSDKAARFIWLCNAFNIPLVYLADVAGFMVGTKVEREGIIRHGAKMVFATSQVTRAATAEARAHVPYNIVLVDAAEGFRMMAHGDNDLVIGDKVTVRFAPFAGRLVPYFEKLKS